MNSPQPTAVVETGVDIGELHATSFAAATAQEAELAENPERSVSVRVVIIALLIACGLGYTIPIVDYKLTNTYLGSTHLPPSAIAVLLIVLLVINPLLKMLSKRLAFSRNEALVLYITCLFSALIPGRGGENFFVPSIIASFYLSTRENKWFDFLHQYLPSWFTPALGADKSYQKTVIENWYEGGGHTIPWAAWIVPLLAWTTLIFAIYGMLACLGVMLRAQWAEREALAFPLLRLPMEMTEDMDRPDRFSVIGRFFRNPLMWVGFGIAVLIQGCNGLNLYFPEVPKMPLDLPTGGFFTEAPWNQMGGLSIKVWLLVLGVSFLLTSEVSFSLWFFFLLVKAQMILLYYLGIPWSSLAAPTWTRGNAKGFIAFEQFGAYIAYVAIILWTARFHIALVVRRAFGRVKADENERREPLSYPVAFWGFVTCFAIAVFWTCAAGARLDVALVLWITYLIVAIGLTRVVVEGGLLFVHSGWSPTGPLASLLGAGPGAWLNPASAVPTAFIGNGLMMEMRGFLLPSFVQSFKLADDRKIPLKPLLLLIFAVIVVAYSLGVWQNINLGYSAGGLKLLPWWSYAAGAMAPAKNAQELIGGVQENFWLNWIMMIGSMIVTFLIMLARSRFSWFPLHPIGIVMCEPYAIQTMWFSIFLGWLCKSVITRYGGTDNYRKAIPLFLGLALGDVIMMLLWLLVDGWQGRMGHNLMPS